MVDVIQVLIKYKKITLAVSTAMFVLDAGDNLWPLSTRKPPAVLSLDSPALVVQLLGVDVCVHRDRGVITGQAALVRHTQLPPHQAVIRPLGADEPKSFTYNLSQYSQRSSYKTITEYAIKIIHLKHSQHEVRTYPSV